MDLNGDNVEDLVLFDRMADKVLTFIGVESKYQYAPEFEEFFPEDITNWLLIRDFNCDGKKDIFTGDIFGINVYHECNGAGRAVGMGAIYFLLLGSLVRNPKRC